MIVTPLASSARTISPRTMPTPVTTCSIVAAGADGLEGEVEVVEGRKERTDHGGEAFLRRALDFVLDRPSLEVSKISEGSHTCIISGGSFRGEARDNLHHLGRRGVDDLVGDSQINEKSLMLDRVGGVRIDRIRGDFIVIGVCFWFGRHVGPIREGSGGGRSETPPEPSKRSGEGALDSRSRDSAPRR